MSESCGNCGAEITQGTLMKAPNSRITDAAINLVNFVDNTCIVEMCQKCGDPLYDSVTERVRKAIKGYEIQINARVADFPMMTVHQLPGGASYKIKSLVTANVSVGTGIFSELSQGISDLFGAINTETGMAYKVNSGEAVARATLASKAMNSGANCIIGVDLDYGTTTNNAATINMQGTAVKIENLADVLDSAEFNRAQQYQEIYDQMMLRVGWLNGNLREMPS